MRQLREKAADDTESVERHCNNSDAAHPEQGNQLRAALKAGAMSDDMRDNMQDRRVTDCSRRFWEGGRRGRRRARPGAF